MKFQDERRKERSPRQLPHSHTTGAQPHSPCSRAPITRHSASLRRFTRTCFCSHGKFRSLHDRTKTTTLEYVCLLTMYYERVTGRLWEPWSRRRPQPRHGKKKVRRETPITTSTQRDAVRDNEVPEANEANTRPSSIKT